MARFFFDIQNGSNRFPDHFGEDCDSFKDACKQAIALLPDIARETLPDNEAHDFVCELRDHTGQIVYRAKLLLRAGRVNQFIDGAAAH